MEPAKQYWGNVRQGTIIRNAKTGHLWKVAKMNKTHVGLRDRDNEEQIIDRPSNMAPVTIMVLTDGEMQDILKEQLGARELYQEIEGKSSLTAKSWELMDKRERLDHLEIMHHCATGTVAVQKMDLDKLHISLHTEKAPRGLLHVHLGTPEVEERRRLT